MERSIASLFFSCGSPPPRPHTRARATTALSRKDLVIERFLRSEMVRLPEAACSGPESDGGKGPGKPTVQATRAALERYRSPGDTREGGHKPGLSALAGGRAGVEEVEEEAG